MFNSSYNGKFNNISKFHMTYRSEDIVMTNTSAYAVFTHNESNLKFIPYYFTIFFKSSTSAPGTSTSLSMGIIGPTYADYVGTFATAFSSIGTYSYPTIASAASARIPMKPNDIMYARSSNFTAGRNATLIFMAQGVLI